MTESRRPPTVRRELTDDERARGSRLLAAVPPLSSRHWRSPEGRAFLRWAQDVHADGVPHEWLARAFDLPVRVIRLALANHRHPAPDNPKGSTT